MTNKQINFRINSNKQKRTFTIRKNDCKYRTCQVNKDEFYEMENYTFNDWSEFLKDSQSYYKLN
jgi:hypothetical protein